MRILNIKVLSNKKMYCSSNPLTLGNKGDNNTSKLVFEIDDDLLQYNNFLLLTTPDATHTYCCPILNNEFVITSTICNVVGNWTLTFISTSQEEVVDNNIDYSQAIMVSDSLVGIVKDSKVSGELETLPIDENMKILYNDLLTIRNDLNTLIEDYPEIESYIEVQTLLNEILYKMDHIQIDTSGLSVEVDMSETNAKIDDLSEQVANIPTNDYSESIDNVENKVNIMYGDVQNLNGMINSGVVTPISNVNYNVESIERKINSVISEMGNNDTKKDGTLFNYSYWGLIRAEEAKYAALNNNALLQTIYTQMSDANELTNQILMTLEE
jgi:hypothetical protein